MSAPSHMSLPRAAELPVLRMDFSDAVKKRMLDNGIVSALQVAEITARHPHLLKELTGISSERAIRVLRKTLGPLPDFKKTAVSFDQVPPPGAPLRSYRTRNHPVRHSRLAAQSEAVRQRLAELDDLPDHVDLSGRMQPVGNQGPFGTCVGWACNAAREFVLQRPMSPGYAYRGGKSRDGFAGEGTWQEFVLEHFFQTGHVSEADYPYAAAIREDPIDQLAGLASKARIPAHAQLLIDPADASLPKLMRAFLAGQFNPELGPLPLIVSLALYPSFISTSTALDGLIPMPRKNEKRRGGHAMCVVGYINATAAQNPFGIPFFLVRNSWGADWAGQNPLGRPGHAMIPEAYFTDPRLVRDVHICVGG